MQNILFICLVTTTNFLFSQLPKNPGFAALAHMLLWQYVSRLRLFFWPFHVAEAYQITTGMATSKSHYTSEADSQACLCSNKKQ